MLFFVMMDVINFHHASLGSVGGLYAPSWPLPVSVVVTVDSVLFGCGIICLATAYQPPCCTPCACRQARCACVAVACILWNKSGAFRCGPVSVRVPVATPCPKCEIWVMPIMVLTNTAWGDCNIAEAGLQESVV